MVNLDEHIHVALTQVKKQNTVNTPEGPPMPLFQAIIPLPHSYSDF